MGRRKTTSKLIPKFVHDLRNYEQKHMGLGGMGRR